MSPEQLDQVPTRVLVGRDTGRLEDWLREHGLVMSLLEMDTLRRDRGVKPPFRPRAER